MSQAGDSSLFVCCNLAKPERKCNLLMATMKLLFLINILHKAPHDKFGKDNEQGWVGGGIPVWGSVKLSKCSFSFIK